MMTPDHDPDPTLGATRREYPPTVDLSTHAPLTVYVWPTVSGGPPNTFNRVDGAKPVEVLVPPGWRIAADSTYGVVLANQHGDTIDAYTTWFVGTQRQNGFRLKTTDAPEPKPGDWYWDRESRTVKTRTPTGLVFTVAEVGNRGDGPVIAEARRMEALIKSFANTVANTGFSRCVFPGKDPVKCDCVFCDARHILASIDAAKGVAKFAGPASGLASSQ